MKIKCSQCREVHDLSDLAWSFNEPRQWWLLRDDEREKSELSPDCCVIHSDEGTSFYIRGTLLIPIQGSDQKLSLSVWSSLSEKSFCEVEDSWNGPERVRLGPYFGWFASSVPFVPDSMYLECAVIQREPGVRPLIELRRDHPLTQYQQKGLTGSELRKITATLFHQ